jgi:hypothetical protein
VNVGVPEHVGPTLKTTGGGGRLAPDVLQQIWPVQSLLSWHDCGQVAAQIPLQQIGDEAESQSDDVAHAVSHGVYAGFRHRPVEVSVGSTFLTVVQQISPCVVSHSELVEQAFGHSLAGRQMALS